MKVKRTNTLQTLKEKNRHERKMKRLDSDEVKKVKEAERTKRYLAKKSAQSRKAGTKTVARSSAAAAMSGSQAAAQAEKSKAEQATVRYNALINGNINGTNAVDPSKDGSNAVTQTGSTNVWEGW